MGANEKHAATYHGVTHNPDTDLVRTVYAGASPVPSYEERETAFNRWLETVRAEAWDEGCAAGIDCGLTIGEKILGIKEGRIGAPPENPYRANQYKEN